MATTSTTSLAFSLVLLLWSLPAHAASPGPVACPVSCNCRHSEDGELAVDCSGRGLADIPANLDISTVHLDLSANNIRRVPADVFERFRRLQSVKLNDNWISEIESKAFNGLRLRRLDLSRNNIVTLTGGSLDGLHGGINCSMSHPCVLDLQENRMQVVESYAMSWIKGITVLLGNSSFDIKLEAYAFYGAENISLISVGNVPSLQIEPRVFTNTNLLKKLVITNTNLKDLQKFTFEGLKDVEEIIFTKCHFDSVDQFSFSGITYKSQDVPEHRTLQELPDYTILVGGGNLSISDSSIRTLAEDTFRDTNLKSIVFKDNHIGAIEAHAFRGLHGLAYLELSGNKIGYLESEALGSLRNVPHIKLAQNDIGVIEEHAFKSSNGIDRLSIHLRANSNLTFGSYAFSGLRDIGTLEIRGAPGSYVQVAADAFHDLGGVHVFHIANLSLPSLGQHTFRGLSKVQTIRFEYCNISEVNVAAFGEPRATGAVATIELNDGNNLPCDCGTNKLLRDFEARFSEFTVTCYTESGEPRVLTEDTLDWPSCQSYSAAPSFRLPVACWTVLLVWSLLICVFTASSR